MISWISTSILPRNPFKVSICPLLFGHPALHTKNNHADPTLDREGQPLEPRPAEDNGKTFFSVLFSLLTFCLDPS